MLVRSWSDVSEPLQNARQTTPVPQQQNNPLGQGLGQFGQQGANAGQQNTLANLLAGAYSQTPGEWILCALSIVAVDKHAHRKGSPPLKYV